MLYSNIERLLNALPEYGDRHALRRYIQANMPPDGAPLLDKALGHLFTNVREGGIKDFSMGDK